MSKHTPGLWQADEHMVFALNAKGYNRFHLIIEAGYDDSGNRIYGTEVFANASLIAAAPELLEALIRVLMWEPRSTEDACEQDYEFARATIAKAEGKA